MTEIVPSDIIEGIVGTKRSKHIHHGRVTEQGVYILHSQTCLDSGIDLRDCVFSKALDKGLAPRFKNSTGPKRLVIVQGRLGC